MGLVKSWQITLIGFASFLLMVMTTVFFMAREQKLAEARTQHSARGVAQAEENVANMRIVTAF